MTSTDGNHCTLVCLWHLEREGDEQRKKQRGDAFDDSASGLKQ